MMKFTQNNDKKPVNRNKVTTDNLNGPFPGNMRLAKCCVSFVFKCISMDKTVP